ncbi:MAG: hypothetical protein MUC94_11155 [bacterium]|nr:hypothetical protein [bacterium]
METQFEKIIKLILVVIVALGIVLFFLLPKTRLAKKFRMNEKLFIITNIIGVICGMVGLAMTFIFPQSIVELHLWELIIAPFALIYTYWLMIVRIRKRSEILDEKQDYNMTKAGAITMAVSIPAMVIMFQLYYNKIVDGPIWFPYYFFVTLLLFSGTTLFLFKKE